MMWTFVVIAGVELVVVHLLLSFYSPIAALILSAISLAGIVWLVRGLLSFAARPVTLDETGLVMRVGALRELHIPIGRIASLREVASFDRRATINFALVAYPNVVIELREPLRRHGRAITAVAHRLDEPAAFAAALESILGHRD